MRHLFLLCILLLATPLQAVEIYNFSVDVEKTEIVKYTRNILKILEVKDEEGICAIRELHPPLRNQYSDELSWFNALRIWIRGNTTHGGEAFNKPFYPPLMIKEMRTSKTYSATCGPFSVAYAGLLLSFDVPVRLIHVFMESSRSDQLVSHTFNEVWSEKYQKWIVQDVDYNVFWLSSRGDPISAFELRDYARNHTSWKSTITIKPYRDYGDKASVHEQFFDYFYRLTISFQDNYFSADPTKYMENQFGGIFHLISQGEEESHDTKWLEYKKEIKVTSVRSWKTLYAPVNQIIIIPIEEQDRYVFSLDNNILQFDHYQILKNQEGWEDLPKEQTSFSLFKNSVGKGKVLHIRGVSLHEHITKDWKVTIKPL